VAGLAAGLFAAGLFAGRAPLLAGAVGAIGLEYGIGLVAGPPGADLLAPVFGAGLLLVAELGFLSLELRPARHLDPVLRYRLLATAVLVSLALAAGALSLVAASLPVPGGVGLSAAGVAAAVGALAILTWLVRRAQAA